MMTIDEVIVHARKVANEKYTEGMLCHANPNDEELDGCIECAREHEQLAEWLEELKAFKENKWTAIYFRRGYKKAENDYYVQSEKDRKSSYDCGYEVGYSQSIDDFSEAVKKLIVDSSVIRFKDIDEIAEQLKAGGENENYNKEES